MEGVNLYQYGFDDRAVRDGSKLPIAVRRRILRNLEYLRAAPFRSHPGVLVKEVAESRGVWHFHAAGDVRVYYTVVGDLIWVMMVEKSLGVTRKTVRGLRKRH